jgi:hypothetical protein
MIGRIVILLLLSCLLLSCQRHSAQTPGPTAIKEQPLDARSGFSSAELMTKFLEQRWPIWKIRKFCTTERRHNPFYQQLVAYEENGPVWEGTLHSTRYSSLDKIAWYATTKNGRVDLFQLSAKRGSDFWVLEISNEDMMTRPPYYTPDPTWPGFVGKK